MASPPPPPPGFRTPSGSLPMSPLSPMNQRVDGNKSLGERLVAALRSEYAFGTSLAKNVTGSVTTKSQESDKISRVQPKTESSDEISKNKIEESAKHETKNQHGAVSLTTSAVARLSVEGSDRTTDTVPKMSHTIFTPRRISVSISASENIRLVCSVIIALLVVLSYHGCSLGINALGSITSFRPLLLVFLTDATVILASLVINQANEQKGKETARSTAIERDGSAMNIGSSTMVSRAVAQAFPEVKVTVLDLPHVIKVMDKSEGRIQYVDGDMFEYIPPGRCLGAQELPLTQELPRTQYSLMG
ncbi:uncharacterized protein A4U43_C03F24930 [Asparagus officinalis]|uniref:O-methyltransferase C-terminal domain-containing protein n=1 Tax=Asparagus officinalis TaxID=4686 RepID=A0A5P1FDK8_ASPOF|nr:uncharacterized protein A4U43_C03F24930 [Asparagus officinalis]